MKKKWRFIRIPYHIVIKPIENNIYIYHFVHSVKHIINVKICHYILR